MLLQLFHKTFIIAQLLAREQVEVVRLNFKQGKNWEASLWRFYPAAEKDVAVMISRDTDARLNWREKAAVDEWMKKDIMGMIEAYLSQVDNQQIEHGIDQRFLADIIYPLVQEQSLVHDEIFAEKPFPLPRNNYEFVGQSFDENNNIYQKNMAQLKQYILLRSQSKAQKTYGYSQQNLNISEKYDSASRQ